MEIGTFYEFLSGLSRDSLSLAVNGLLIGVSLTTVAWLVWRLVKNHDAALSYAAWWLVLAAVIVTPFLLSSSGTQLPKADHSASVSGATIEDWGETVVLPSLARSGELPRSQSEASRILTQPELTPKSSTIMEGAAANSRWRDAGNLLIGLAPISIFGLWLCICLGLIARLWHAYRHMTAIKQSAIRLPSHLDARARSLISESGLTRSVKVGMSSQIKFPMAAGLGDPTILIPSYLVDKLEPAELDVIVLHEIFHLRRWDDWTKLLQRMVEAVMFFNPVVSWIGRRLDQVREMACDDRVVAQTGRPTDYARCLTKLAEMNVSDRGLLVPGALVNRKFIFRRLDRVLNPAKRSSGQRSGWQLAAIAATVVLAVTLLVQVSPAVSLPLEPLSYKQLAGEVNSLLESFSRGSSSEALEGGAGAVALADLESQQTSLSRVSSQVSQISESLQTESLESIGQSVAAVSKAVDQQAAALADVNDGSKPAELSGVDLSMEDSEDTGACGTSRGRSSSRSGGVFDDSRSGTMISHCEGRTEITFNDGRNKFRVEYEGEIQFADDDSDIESMSDDAYFYLADKRGRELQEIEVELDENGELRYRYFVDRDKAEFDDDAREWFERRLAYAIRSTGVNAPARVDRWYAAGGADRALDEIEEIENNYARTEHLKALVSIDLSGEEYSDVLVYIGRELDADYDKAELLMVLAERHPPDQSTISDYLGVVETIDSDYETRRVLGSVLYEDNVDEEVAARLLKIAGEMDSDYEKSELLIDWADQMSDNEQLLVELVDVVAMIDSDYETRRVLSRVGFGKYAGEATIMAVLKIAGKMDSDYEKAELLIPMAPRCRESKELESAYMRALGNLDSDYETRRVLSALSKDRVLDADITDEMLDMTHLLDSDYEKAEMLIELIRSCDDQPHLQNKVVQAAATLDSDYETRRVLSSLHLDCERTPDMILSVMEIVEKMSSDYETAEVLLDLSECAEDDAVVRAAYLKAVGRLGSDYEKQRCLSPLLEDRDMDATRLREFLSVIETIESDYDRGQMIKALIPACRGNDELEDLLTESIETIDSDYTINELYAKLYGRSTRDIGMD
jgi:beta-lactamase regulating signal transducer with metallopeptidase domain